MADREFPVPKDCPVIRWCNKGFPCYCQDAPAPVSPSPGNPAQPATPGND